MEKTCKHFYNYNEPPHFTEICRADGKPCNCGGLKGYCHNGEFEPIDYEEEIEFRQSRKAKIKQEA